MIKTGDKNHKPVDTTCPFCRAVLQYEPYERINDTDKCPECGNRLFPEGVTRDRKDILWDEIVENFGWERVHVAMKALDWKWYGSSEYPTVMELQKFARELFDKAWSTNNTVASGGFHICIDRDEQDTPYCRLSFEIDDSWIGINHNNELIYV